jgi:hypothetical protein
LREQNLHLLNDSRISLFTTEFVLLFTLSAADSFIFHRYNVRLQEKLQGFAVRMSSISQIYFHTLNAERQRLNSLPRWRRFFSRNVPRQEMFMQALSRMSDLDIIKLTEGALGYSLPQFQQSAQFSTQIFSAAGPSNQKDREDDSNVVNLSSTETSRRLPLDRFSTADAELKNVGPKSNELQLTKDKHQSSTKITEAKDYHCDVSERSLGSDQSRVKDQTLQQPFDSLVGLQEVVIHSPDTQASIPQNRDSSLFSQSGNNSMALKQTLTQRAPNSSPAYASAVSRLSASQRTSSTMPSREAATPPLDETENSSKSGFLSRTRVMTMWREYLSQQSSLDDEQASGQLHELMVLDTLPDKHPSLHVDETEAARSSGHQEGTISENVVDDRKKVSVRVLPQHRPANEAVMGAATDTAVEPSKRLGGMPAAKPPISERSRDAELLTSVSYTASHKQVIGVSDRPEISPMRSAVHMSSSVNALAKSRGLPKESASGSAKGAEIARDGGLERVPSCKSSRIANFGALHDTSLREIVVEIDARDVKQPSAPKSKSTLASAKLPNSPNSVNTIEELSDAFGAPPPFDADDLKLAKRREEKAAARDAQRRSVTRSAAASLPLGDVHRTSSSAVDAFGAPPPFDADDLKLAKRREEKAAARDAQRRSVTRSAAASLPLGDVHRTSSSAVDAFGAPPPFDADDWKLAKRREAKTSARSAHGPVEEQRVSGTPGISNTATPSLGGSVRHKPEANPIQPLSVSASLPIEEGSAQSMSQRGASRTSGAGKVGAGSGRVENENRAELKKHGSSYAQS